MGSLGLSGHPVSQQVSPDCAGCGQGQLPVSEDALGAVEGPHMSSEISMRRGRQQYISSVLHI